jgi:O-antigen/teichoic acid export membrane protein
MKQLFERAVRVARRTGTLDLGASATLVLTIGFAQNLVLARVLGADGLGHMAVIYSTLSVAGVFGAAGLTSAVLRYGAAARDAAAAWDVFRRCARMCLAFSIGVALAVAALSRSPLWVFDPVSALWMPLAVWTLPASVLASCASAYLQSRDQMRDKALIDVYVRVCVVAGVLGGALLHGFEGSAIGYTAGSIAGGCIAVSRAFARRPPTTAAAPVGNPELLRFGLWGLLTNVLGLGLHTADIFCVSALVRDPAKVGVYSLAAQLQQIVGIPMRAYQDARFPEMTRLSSDPPRLRALWRRMRTQLVVVAVLVSLALGAIAPWLLPVVFGADFAGSALPLAILLFGQVFWSAGTAPGRSMFAAGWIVGNFWLSVFSATATIAVNLALIPHFGIAGAALATAATHAAWAVLTTLVCRWYETHKAPA